MKKIKRLSIFGIMVLSLSLAVPSFNVAARPLAQTAPLLGTFGSYQVLSAAGITDVTNGSTFTADVGSAGVDTDIIASQVSAPGVLNPATVGTALSDAAAAWLALSTPPQPGGSSLSLAGSNTVGAGVYDINANPTGGTLTLSGPGVYIFRSASSVADPGGFTVTLTGGADPCNVFWQIQTSWSSGAGSVLVGTFITQTASITLANGTTVDGRVIALGAGQVTLINNHFTGPTCLVAPTTVPGGGVSGLPNTGGAPIRNDEAFPWGLVLVILGGFGVIALLLGVRAYRRTNLPK
jgi:type VI secretion system secreted protein VgrG